MLSSLLIRNFAIIEDLEMEFSSGLNIITGETGAGKSVILGALQLLLGYRADKTLIRTGAHSSEICGIFQLGNNTSLINKIDIILEKSGVSRCDDGQLVVMRKIYANSNKSYINSSVVTINLLITIGDLLVDVHGPYDHQSLVHPKTQLGLLDAFSKLESDVEKCSIYFKKLSLVRQEIEAFQVEMTTPDRVDIMRFQLNEIARVAPKEDEDTQLTSLHESAANRHEILEILNRSIQCLNRDSGILNQVAFMMRELTRLQRMNQQDGTRFTQSLENIYNNLNEFHNELTSYVESIDIDPATFTQLEERLGQIQNLKKKYGGSITNVLEYAHQTEEKLAQLENKDEVLRQLNEKEKETEAVFLKQARLVSEKRKKDARKLEKLITEKLQSLGFKDCLFSIEFDTVSANPSGIDSVEFHFGPNPGEGCKALREIASTGEISRVMLAIKTILAKVDEVPVLVFDEIDVNIGGVVAGKVGQELARLGENHQILCITHLPQVAAKGDRHFFIDKTTTNGRTKATVTPLTGKNRIQEIARMLGGKDSASVILKHASELIGNAQD